MCWAYEDYGSKRGNGKGPNVSCLPIILYHSPKEDEVGDQVHY